MKVTWLGWAGVEVEAAGAVLVIDPLKDPDAMVAPFGDQARDIARPALAAASVKRTAVGGLVTHLHRDHADARALADALASDAPVLGPLPGGGESLDQLGLAQAEAELERLGLGVTPAGTVGGAVRRAVPRNGVLGAAVPEAAVHERRDLSAGEGDVDADA